MLLIACPVCGVCAEETEFQAGGEAHIRRAAPDADEAGYYRYLFERKNPRGVHFEKWRHAFGCGKWFHMARNTGSMEIYGVYGAGETEPPAACLAEIRRRSGNGDDGGNGATARERDPAGRRVGES